MTAILYLISIPIIIYITNLSVVKFKILKKFFFKYDIPHTGSFILSISLLFVLKDNLSFNFFYFILLIIAVLIAQKNLLTQKFLIFLLNLLFYQF